MRTEKAEQLIDKYNSGEATPAESQLVESWYLKMKEGETLSPDELHQEYELGFRQLDLYFIRRRTTFRLRIAAAAAVIIMASAVLYSYNYQNRGIKERITAAQDIPPGKNTAILTLANGETLKLSEAQHELSIGRNALTYKDGTVAKQTASGAVAVLTAQTPRGGTYNFTLSDGTIVMLNADSYLKFPQSFSGKNRMVELKGEAYFEVAKNKAMPFIVKTEKQSIEVLGTHFNINNYSEAAGSTTLLEGSVKVTAGQSEKILVPGQQASLINEQLVVKKADLEAVVSWKDGYFRFNDENIQEIMQKIARWYDVDVTYEGDIPKEGFTGAISTFSNISDVLDMLERTKIVHFKLEGRRVIVLN